MSSRQAVNPTDHASRKSRDLSLWERNFLSLFRVRFREKPLLTISQYHQDADLLASELTPEPETRTETRTKFVPASSSKPQVLASNDGEV